MEILRIRHEWPEKAGFHINHRADRDDYIFIHFTGSVELCIGSRHYITKPHACVVFDKRSPVYFKSETALLHDWMHFTGAVSQALAAYGLSTDTLYYPKSHTLITEIMKELEMEHFAGKAFAPEMINLKLNELFIRLSRSTLSDESAEQYSNDVVVRFKELRRKVFSNLPEKYTVADLAKEVTMSESRFFVAYREIFGISPMNDIISARIELSKNLLLSRGYSVDEVASLAGYSSTFHFIRQFKKHVGMTPGEYTREQKASENRDFKTVD